MQATRMNDCLDRMDRFARDGRDFIAGKKNRAGPKPCSQDANLPAVTLRLRLEFLFCRSRRAPALRRLVLQALVLPRLGPRGLWGSGLPRALTTREGRYPISRILSLGRT